MRPLHRSACLLLTALFLLLPLGARGEERHLVHDGQERRYLIRKPPRAAPGVLRPAVIVLHGGGGNAESAERMTGFTAVAGGAGAIVVYPEGTSRFAWTRRLKTWNAGHCCGYAMKNDIDDVGFIRALIDEIVAKDGADPRRISVTGLSNGGMMTHRLGIALSGKIAAIAPVIGGLFGDERRPAAPVPALIVNGALDQSIPLEGGPTRGRFPDAWDGTPLAPAARQGAFWAAANGCQTAPRMSRRGAVQTATYACPSGGAVIHQIVLDNGHAWPGGEKGARGSDEPSRALDATREIWTFLARQSR